MMETSQSELLLSVKTIIISPQASNSSDTLHHAAIKGIANACAVGDETD